MGHQEDRGGTREGDRREYDQSVSYICKIVSFMTIHTYIYCLERYESVGGGTASWFLATQLA